MKDLSLNVLDITHNSISANANTIEVSIDTSGDKIIINIKDDGCGMSNEMLEKVTDPFTTTRTTRRVGMGIPLLKLAAEQSGGFLKIESILGKGTDLRAEFNKNHIDCPPLGDMASTIAMLMAAIGPETDLIYRFTSSKSSFELKASEIREILGDDISLSEPEIQAWIRGYIEEQEKEIFNHKGEIK